MAKSPLPTPAMIRNILKYDPQSGSLFWRPRCRDMFSNPRTFNMWNTRFAGKSAFTAISRQGYRFGQIFNYPYLAHRVILAMINDEWPDHVDHLNGDKLDNRIANLKSGTRSANMRNRKLPSDNKTGVIGVYYDKRRKHWVAAISDKDGSKQRSFGTIEDAEKFRQKLQRDRSYSDRHGTS